MQPTMKKMAGRWAERALLFVLALSALALGVETSRAVAQTPGASGSFGIAATAGTASITSKTFFGKKADLCVVSVAWTSDASGNVTIALPSLAGEIVEIETNPGATAPTDNYDIALNDADASDLTSGAGANRDTANTETFVPLKGNGTGAFGLSSANGYWPVLIAGPATLAISNAGDSKDGVFRLKLAQ